MTTATKGGEEDAFTRDMALAQAEMENAAYNRVNPHFRSKYADYAAVREAIAPAYKHGFRTNFTHHVSYAPNGDLVRVLRLTVKRNGEAETSEWIIEGDNAQQRGSSTTYGKRYLLSSYFAIASEEDDDGNEATNTRLSKGASEITRGQKTLSKEQSRPIYDGLIKEMRSLKFEGDLTAWAMESTDRIYAMHDEFQRWFRDEYRDHLTAIKEGVDEDGVVVLAEPETDESN